MQSPSSLHHLDCDFNSAFEAPPQPNLTHQSGTILLVTISHFNIHEFLKRIKRWDVGMFSGKLFHRARMVINGWTAATLLSVWADDVSCWGQSGHVIMVLTAEEMKGGILRFRIQELCLLDLWQSSSRGANYQWIQESLVDWTCGLITWKSDKLQFLLRT